MKQELLIQTFLGITIHYKIIKGGWAGCDPRHRAISQPPPRKAFVEDLLPWGRWGSFPYKDLVENLGEIELRCSVFQPPSEFGIELNYKFTTYFGDRIPRERKAFV